MTGSVVATGPALPELRLSAPPGPAAVVEDRISGRAAAAARELADGCDSALADVFLAGYLVLAGRSSGESEILVGIRSEASERPGSWPSTMTAVTLRLPARMPFRELVRAVGAAVAASAAPRPGTFPGPLTTALTVTHAGAGAPAARDEPGTEGGLAVLVELRVGSGSGEIPVAARYDTGGLTGAAARRLLRRYVTLLAAAVTDPGRDVHDLPMLPAGERHLVISAWNQTGAAEIPGNIVAGFTRQAAATPDRLAVADEHGTTLTYAQLRTAANALARRLLQAGVRAEQRCAVMVDRTALMPVAILATLKAGAAYVPLDLTTPGGRVSDMLLDASAAVVITERKLDHLRPPGPWQVLYADEAAFPGGGPPEDPDVEISPRQLAYVMYTSGSTGRPKGVLIEHGCVTAFVEGCRRSYRLGEDDTYLQFSSLAFDVSTFDIFCALLTGASVHVASMETRRSLPRVRRMLRDRGITVYMGTPGILKLLDPGDFPRLRLLAVGGEPYPGEFVSRWRAGRQFFNSYGPTETTVGVVIHECTGPIDGPPPIGRAMPRHRAYVLDPRMWPVPVGVPGELCIGGPGVGRGYLGRPGQTAERFVPDPWSGEPGARLYRTGDLAQWRPDGQIVFLGRSDSQVKIRGMRVELGEVTEVISAQPQIAQAVVRAVADPVSGARIVAYLVPAPGAAWDELALRTQIGQRLPDYMMPSELIPLAAVPLGDTGKVDESALTSARAAAGAPAAAPPPASGPSPAMTATERQLVTGILRPLLGADALDPGQNLFEFGATSLHVVQMLDLVYETFAVEVTANDFFDDPTVRGLARCIDQERWAGLRASVAESYEQIATDYHAFRSAQADPPPDGWLAAPHGQRADVLELGIGGSPLAAALGTGHRVTGVDASGRLLAQASARLPSATLVRADLLAAALPDASFDWVLARDVLPHLPREQLGVALRQISAWLRPGGTLVARLTDEDEPGSVAEWFGSPVFRAGFGQARTWALIGESGLRPLARQRAIWLTPAGPVPAVWILARRDGPAAVTGGHRGR